MQSADLLDCPVCLEEMRPPKKIFQCSNGHSLCEQCKNNPALTSCPICRIEFTKSNVSRNILAESMASQVISIMSPSAPPLEEPHQNIQKNCPVCNQIFGHNIPEYVFQKHVREHFGGDLFSRSSPPRIRVARMNFKSMILVNFKQAEKLKSREMKDGLMKNDEE